MKAPPPPPPPPLPTLETPKVEEIMQAIRTCNIYQFDAALTRLSNEHPRGFAFLCDFYTMMASLPKAPERPPEPEFIDEYPFREGQKLLCIKVNPEMLEIGIKVGDVFGVMVTQGDYTKVVQLEMDTEPLLWIKSREVGWADLAAHFTLADAPV